jgi:hypothetical protein
MHRRGLLFLSVGIAWLSLLTSCQNASIPVSADAGQTSDNGDGVSNTAVFSESIAEVLAANDGSHEAAGDYVWTGSQAVQIALNGNAVNADGAGVTVSGGIVTIESAGNYSVSGVLTDGQIVVNTADEDVVRLILNGADIRCSTSAAIYIKNAEKVILILADNTDNRVSDGTSYVYDDVAEKEPDAAVFSKADLTLCGGGSLTVAGNFSDGIAGKDGLVIKSGTITVASADDGIRGRDYVIVRGGEITVAAGGDGLTSTNDEDAARGFVLIESGEIAVTSSGDAVSAETDALVADGNLILVSGGGSGRTVASGTSAKGIKSGVNAVIDGGFFSINSADDAVHSDVNLAVNGGTFDISTGDDGLHSDSTLGINGGTIRIAKSYEGIESAAIVVNGGNIRVISSDDGVNAAGGGGDAGMTGPGMGGPGATAASGKYSLTINGGYLSVNALGDGLDINGAIVMTDGVVVIHGPVRNDNGAVDYDASFKMTGGFLVAAGSSGMAQAPGAASTQYCLLLNFNLAQQAGTLFHIQTGAGEDILTFAPARQYQSIAFSSPRLAKGSTYNVYYGGSDTGTATDGLYQNGTYSPGAKYVDFTVSGIVTKVNSR